MRRLYADLTRSRRASYSTVAATRNSLAVVGDDLQQGGQYYGHFYAKPSGRRPDAGLHRRLARPGDIGAYIQDS
jgi:hypothetical protein